MGLLPPSHSDRVPDNTGIQKEVAAHFWCASRQEDSEKIKSFPLLTIWRAAVLRCNRIMIVVLHRRHYRQTPLESPMVVIVDIIVNRLDQVFLGHEFLTVIHFAF